MMMELELLDSFRVPREADPKPVSPTACQPARQNSSPNTSRPTSPMLRRTVTVRERGERTKGFFQRLGKDTKGMLDNFMGKPKSAESKFSVLSRQETITPSTVRSRSPSEYSAVPTSTIPADSITPAVPHAAERHLQMLARLEALLPSPSPSVHLPMPPILLRVREEDKMRSEKASQELADEAVGRPAGFMDGLTRLNSMALSGGDSHQIRARGYRMGGDVKAGLSALMSGMDDFDGWTRLQRLELMSFTGIEPTGEDIDKDDKMTRTTICERPRAITYYYWNYDDETIQDVIDGLTTAEEHVCPRGGCDVSQEEHIRWWLHDGKKLGMLVRRAETGMGEGGLDCWVKCADCKKHSEPRILGDIAS
jgi:1-phosphatidylinositol-3-phosphate 5-kinase